MNRDAKSKPDPFTPADFMPKSKVSQNRPATREELLGGLESVFGDRFKRKGDAD